jgi:hypothetical protein
MTPGGRDGRAEVPMEWFFQLPLPALFLLIVGFFVTVTVTFALRLGRLREDGHRRHPRSSEQAAYFGTQIWLVYSLVLSLVAVGAWSEYQAASEKVAREVAVLEVLQRRAALYPEPMRTRIDTEVREYARAVAEKEWPEQKAGRHPSAAKRDFADIIEALSTYTPDGLARQMMHAETLREASIASEARRARIHATHGALPGVVWVAMLLGAALALSGATFFVHIDDRILRVVLISIMAAFVGLVVFTTAALDHPFQGDVTPSEKGFVLVADRPFGGP